MKNLFHLPIYIVGGYVRDLLLDRPGEDFDIVVEGDAIGLARSLSSKFGGRVVSHSRFGTAKWQIREIAADLVLQIADSMPLDPNELPDTLDFISARREFYEYPTALPTVERSSIKLDLHRRDFTINTMALRLDGRHHGELYDYWGGLTDLKKKQIRVLHSLSFVDDPTRMLRAARFEQRFHFHIESRTLQLIKEARDLLHQVSGDRIRHEFNLIFQEDDPPAVLSRLEDLELLDAIIPGLHWGKQQITDWNNFIIQSGQSKEGGKNKYRKMFSPEDFWLVLFHQFDFSQLENATLRLKLPVGTGKLLLAAARLQSRLPELPDLSTAEVVKLLDALPEASIRAVAAMNSTSPGGEVIRKYFASWQKIHPIINGRNLEQMGIPRGPHYRTILDDLRSAWISGEISSQP
ncbi:MAG TPA: hypothetical protein VF338_03390, partial [Leptolinea sp.]